MMLCTVEGCNRFVHSKGLCQAHYRQQARRAADPLVGTRKRGPVAKPGAVSHQALAPEERARRAVEREAARTHCDNGHLLTETNIYVYPEGAANAGKRVCKTCRRNAQQRYRGRPESGDVPVGPWNRDKTACPRGHEYTEFGRTNPDGSRTCKPCANWNVKEKKYEITREQYDALVLAQHNACAICRRDFIVTPSIDHDHTTGGIRELLCNSCNNGLGRFFDNADTLRAAADYLDKWNALR